MIAMVMCLIYLDLTVITMTNLFSSLIFSYVRYYLIRKCPLGKGRLADQIYRVFIPETLILLEDYK